MVDQPLIRFESDWLGVSVPKPLDRFHLAGWLPDDSAVKGLAYCPKCGQTLGTGEFRQATESCSNCFNRRFPFRRIVRLGAYTSHLRNWTHHIKFERDYALGTALAHLLGKAVVASGIAGRIDLVVPMPTTFRRRWRRGIDHSASLGRVVGRQINRPFVHALRKNSRPPQRAVPGLERRSNVRHSIHPARFMPIHGAQVLLVDDIITTHSSVIEASQTLLQKCGAAGVSVAVLAVTDDRQHPNLPTSERSVSSDAKVGEIGF